MNIELELNGLNCLDCASKIEDLASEIQGVNSTNLNFVTKKFKLDIDDNGEVDIISKRVIDIIKHLEPDVDIVDLTNNKTNDLEINLKLEGLNCADCATKIDKFTKSIKGVESVNLEFLTNKMKVKIRENIDIDKVKLEINHIVKTLEPDVEVIDLDFKRDKEKKTSFIDKIDRDDLYRMLISGILAITPVLFGFTGIIRFLFYFASYLIIGQKVIIQAFKNTMAGVPFDENFLMTIATIGAFVIGEYPEGVMVMLLYQIGETMQGIAVNHSRDSITSLMDIRPDYANLKLNGEILTVDPEEIKIGDLILVRPGEKVPLDGIVVEGESSLDTSNITGESVPRSVKIGEDIYSGVVNLQGLLTLKVTKEFGESTISKVLDLVENASSKKAETENFITKFSRYYTPVVVFIALGIAIIPSVFMGGAWKEWLYRASVFLVISCPCALVISVPLGFFGGLGAASKTGILIKGGNYLEALTEVDTMVFDKTGTITEGIFDVREIHTYDDYSKEEVLEIAAYGEIYSNHPIATSIINKYNREIDRSKLSDYKDIAGKGIEVKLDNEKILIGNKSLFQSNNVTLRESDSTGTVVYVGKENQHIGTIIVSDKIKDNILSDLKELRRIGINEMVMLSGDNKATVKQIGNQVGMTDYYGDLLPHDKVEIFERILEKRKGKSKVAFIGDGVNDAPSLARADVGIAMGGLGSDAAIEASDIVIMTDDIGKIASGIKIARNTKKIVIQNIALALGVKLIVLGLGAFGNASMWQAVFADVGVSIIAILNSIRALRFQE